MSILDDAREGMDHDVRPQDDLFGHVNGRWLAETEIPSDRSSWGPFVQLADVAEEQVARIIEDLAAKATASRARPRATSTPTRRRSATCSPPSWTPSASTGSAPARSSRWSTRSRRCATRATSRRSSASSSGSAATASSAPTSTPTTATPTATCSTWCRAGSGCRTSRTTATRSSPSIREAYVAYLATILRLVDDQVEGGDPEAGAQTVLRIDTRLAEGHWERAETRDVQKTYNLMTVAELRELCPGFDWDVYTTNLSASAHEADELLFEVCVRQPSYFEHLSTVLGEVPIEDWRTWLLTHVVRSAAPYLTDEFVEANFDFYGRTLNGTPELRARWKRGVGLVEGALGEAVGEEYVARHFPPSSKQQMDELVANLLAAYRTSISQLDWMTEETKTRAYDKLATFRPKIGYPEKFRDYSGLSVRPDDLLGNVAASAAFETDRQLNKIGSPVDRDEWFMLPQTVNAYYNPGTNEICFPAGILQKPFFSPDAEPAENYGGIGAVIGHEIGHGFDDQGAQYDGAGNLNDWWTPDDKAAFEVKSKALIEQYDGFAPRDLPDEHVNGSLTVGENIGDLGGLTIGHRAYLISTDGAAAPEDRQKLFMNWAYCWRTKRRLEQAQQYLTIDPHSPPEFRANIVRNLDEFHEVFGTAEGDGLWIDPEQRVRIW